MTYQDLKTEASIFRPILLLERLISHHFRKRVLRFLSTLLLVSILLVITENLIRLGYIENISSVFFSFQFKIQGIFMVLLIFWIIIHLSDSYFYSYYFKNSGTKDSSRFSFELASILYRTSESDLTAGFLTSEYGSLILGRLGLSRADLKGFLGKRRVILSATLLSFDKQKITEVRTISDYAVLIFDHDAEFAEFLFSKRIDRAELFGAADWIRMMAEEAVASERWWTRENLGRIPGIGKTWAYGQIGLLKRYADDLSGALSGNGSRLRYDHEEVKKLEAILSRSREANALLINDNEAGSLSIVAMLAEQIKHGDALPALEHKRMFLLDTNALISHNKEKTALEMEVTKLLNESIRAGNIVLVIENLPGFLSSAKVLGSDLRTILAPYLLSTSLQMIAFSDAGSYHQSLEPDRTFTQHFEPILVKEKGDQALIEMIEKEANRLEFQNRIFFTYQAIAEIVKDAQRYFNDVILSDKSVDLLTELVPRAVRSGKYLIESKDVLSLIESKTGIPTGEVKTEEKEKLVHLEEILHERIIGQDEAVTAVSQTMRRSRSGIEQSRKPMGSFLFLGPTGVGKTETTKALNDAFFKENSEIIRLDMSEYSSYDAMNKLIGSFEGGKQGVLSSLLREHPYGVLLLDEFEKTTEEVKNLFLQILDEGSFKDMTGRTVGAENLIIIATSNAGSDLIWELFQKGESIQEGKDKIIDKIIKEGIFKPELLNRFDKVILFHPLDMENLKAIAKLMLDSYAKRLLARGVRLEITPDLIQFLVNIGADPKFGARPMNRAIVERVEALVAEEMIKGNIAEGSTIQIVQNPLSAGNLKTEKLN